MPLMAGTAGTRGKNHGALPLAILLLGMTLPMAAALAQDDPPAAAPAAVEAPSPQVSYVQRGVPAEATAENGVVARERALANGRRAAWDRIASAAGVQRQLSDAQIEAMVASIIIEEERTSPTRYTGRITVNFVPSRVRALTGGAGQAAMPGGSGDPTAASRSAPPAVPTSTVDAIALYGSLNEWIELRRRLGASARIEVVAISTDRARLRLGLRGAPNIAGEELARQGVSLVPGSGAPGDAWRVGLAGRS
jgi:hypothetical protein